ncbi:MAG: hypothetical protein R2730_09820 [Chitinophagales bacterium]
MIIKRGIVDGVSEAYRLEFLEKGISTTWFKNVLDNGSAQLQNHLLDHDKITKAILLQLAEHGVTKKVRNKAHQKLKSKKFKT